MVAVEPGDETIDSILRGRVRVIQPRRGARFTTDPILLADFVIRTAGLRARRACELGAGTGVLAFVLARLDLKLEVKGIELQPELVAMAERGAALNGLTERVTFERADLRTLPRASYDLVVANPPYHERGRGNVPARPERALAHHETACSLGDMVAAARRLLAPSGRVALIYPAERLAALTQALEGAQLGLELLRFVHARAERPALRLLALARPGPRTVAVHPPLILHEGKGWSAEAASLLEGTC